MNRIGSKNRNVEKVYGKSKPKNSLINKILTLILFNKAIIRLLLF